jgi:hypothetical protein
LENFANPKPEVKIVSNKTLSELEPKFGLRVASRNSKIGRNSKVGETPKRGENACCLWFLLCWGCMYTAAAACVWFVLTPDEHRPNQKKMKIHYGLPVSKSNKSQKASRPLAVEDVQ